MRTTGTKLAASSCPTTSGGCRMARRFIAATFAAVALGVVSAPAASGQVSPPTSAALRTAAVHAPVRQAAPAGGIPRTGSDAVPAAALGIGLAGAGAGLVLVARRQNRAAAD
jgi:LPXTG-motif cell wall-anchored protein